MLVIRPTCERCDRDPPVDAEAWICTFECTWCARRRDALPGGACSNCGGDLQRRPTRPAHLLAAHPASTERVLAGRAAETDDRGPGEDGPADPGVGDYARST